MREKTFPGEELRARREEMGLTRDDVFRKLRIPVKYLRGLEEGTLASLPEMCYAVGFLRTYCLYLGLDPEPYVDCLRECETVHPALRRTGPRHGQGARPRWMQDLYAWAALSAVLILAWITYAIVIQPRLGGESAEGRVQAETVDLRVPESPSDF